MSDMLDTLISANLHKQAVNQPGTNQPTMESSVFTIL